MTIPSVFIERSRQYLAYEYPTKIERCLATLPPDTLWRRSGDGSNSIGNLLLHLEGNVRQWLVSSVGGSPDHRELAARDGADVRTLFGALSATLEAADGVLARLTPDDLLTNRVIQGRDVTVFEAVYHVVEHFALHTGQIILLAKTYAPGSIQFYEDAGGLATPRWPNEGGRL
jgi:uncharacterized damage-inducible protein DinB